MIDRNIIQVYNWNFNNSVPICNDSSDIEHPNSSHIPIDYSKDYVPLFGYKPMLFFSITYYNEYSTIYNRISSKININFNHLKYFLSHLDENKLEILAIYLKNKNIAKDEFDYKSFKNEFLKYLYDYLIYPYEYLFINYNSIDCYKSELHYFFNSSFVNKFYLSRSKEYVLCGSGFLGNIDYKNNLHPLVCLVVKKEALPWVRYKLLLGEPISDNSDGIFKLYIQSGFDYKESINPSMRKVYRKDIIPWAKDLNIPIETVKNLSSELFILPKIPKFDVIQQEQNWIKDLIKKSLYSEICIS